MKETAIKYLSKNYIKNCNLIESLKFDDVEYYYSENDGVCFFDKDAQVLMMSTDNKEVSVNALKKVLDCDLACCQSMHDAECIRARFGLRKCNTCFQVVYTKSEKLPLLGKCEIRKLENTPENVKFVFENYRLHCSEEDIERVIDNMGMYGAYVDKKIVGFIGRHDERSIGLLEVLPEYQRHGIAFELEKFMINLSLDNGWLPFAHVISSNYKSEALQKKVGFEFYEDFVYWLF